MGKRKKEDPAAPQVINVEAIVESKLSKSEAIGLIIDAAQRRVNERIEEIGRKLNELANIGHEEGMKLAHGGKVRVDFRTWNASHGHSPTVVIAVNREYTMASMPTALLKRYSRYVELEAERGRLYSMQGALNERERAKNYVLRQTLEGTEEGRALLQALDAMSIRLGGQLELAAGKK